MKSLSLADLKDKRVLLRVDYNTPIENGIITDPRKIVETLPTIRHILSQKPRSLAIMSHFGRPKGTKDDKYSLKSVYNVLRSLLDQENVLFASDCIGSDTKDLIDKSEPGSIILLENLRFHSEETTEIENKETYGEMKDKILTFRKTLSSYGDVFVSDAFGCLHRAHSSINGLEVSERYCGFLVEKEMKNLEIITDKKDKIDLVIIGGAKVSDKILLIEKLCERANNIIICGGLSFTFLKTLGIMDIGNSIFDEKGSKHVNRIMEKAEKNDAFIHFPIDFVISTDSKEEARIVTQEEGIPENWSGFDCGASSIELFSRIILDSNKILWNGPCGLFEIKKFENGTKSLMIALAEATKTGSITIIGGGETASCAQKWNLADKLTHVSTGGGATLELLEGKELPGIVFLNS
eukprot:GHVP01008406.1.p1 GENE.GHVP01008406.1~~GHVP01008406.1.p1  ORF type:complete len:408 (+),score=76.50 GHVP01008406.1:627-1850(+)